MAVAVIEIQGLTFKYSDSQSDTILSEFSFALQQREIVTMLGPSGSGKTTIAKLITGLLVPSFGRVLYRGRPVFGPGRERGLIPQGDSCFPWLTVRQNVAIAVVNGRASEGVDSLVDSVGLGEYNNAFPKHLSFGMRQRVCLARSLAAGAEVLVLDEPLSAVDALLRLRLQQSLKDLIRKHNLSVLWITHDLAEALLLGDRVIVVSGRPLRVLAEYRPLLEGAPLGATLESERFRALEGSLRKLIFEEWQFVR